jgi:hypothetical protein
MHRCGHRREEVERAGVLMQRNEGEPCRLWTLHQPWLRELPASSLQAGLREPPPLGLRRCHHRASVNTTYRHEEARITENADVGEALRQSGREVLPRRDPNEGALATWDPGGKSLAGEEVIVEARGLLRPAKTTVGSVTCQQDKPGRKVSQKAAPSIGNSHAP